MSITLLQVTNRIFTLLVDRHIWEKILSALSDTGRRPVRPFVNCEKQLGRHVLYFGIHQLVKVDFLYVLLKVKG